MFAGLFSLAGVVHMLEVGHDVFELPSVRWAWL
jgi:hypothetical protein